MRQDCWQVVCVAAHPEDYYHERCIHKFMRAMPGKSLAGVYSSRQHSVASTEYTTSLAVTRLIAAAVSRLFTAGYAQQQQLQHFHHLSATAAAVEVVQSSSSTVAVVPAVIVAPSVARQEL